MVLGPETRAVPYFAATMSLENALCAVDGNGELIGVAGFKTGDTGFLNGGTADIARHYGWIGSLWRLPLLMLLERKEAPETLQMDGICVAEEARGAGVGSALLQALCQHARANGYRRIALDVIDRNPRARALYERTGFSAVAVETLVPFHRIFGFRSATRMELDLMPSTTKRAVVERA